MYVVQCVVCSRLLSLFFLLPRMVESGSSRRRERKGRQRRHKNSCSRIWAWNMAMSATDDDDWKLSQKGKKEEWVLRRAKTEQRKCSSEHRRRWQEESRCRRCVTSIRWCWWLIRLSVVLVCIFAYLHCRAKRRWAHKDEHEQHCGQHIPQSAAAVKLLNWHCATQLSYIIAHHKEDGRLNKTKVLLPTRAQAPDLVFLFFFVQDRSVH